MIRFWTRLSPRERTLITAAFALVLGLAAIYAGLLPGLKAARAAEQRLALAATDHREINAMAAELQARRKTLLNVQSGDMRSRLDAAAVETGVHILDVSDLGAAHSVRFNARSSSAILAFAARAVDAVGGGATTLTISPDSSGLSVTLTLTRPNA